MITFGVSRPLDTLGVSGAVASSDLNMIWQYYAVCHCKQLFNIFDGNDLESFQII